MKITKKIYEEIKNDIDQYSRYDFDELVESYKMRIIIARQYFSEDYSELKKFEISEKCLYRLLDVVREETKKYVYELIEQLEEKIEFEIWDE